MWNTPIGVRSLSGFERQVFKDAGSVYLAIILDMTNDGLKIGSEDGRPNNDRFDRLSWPQQIVSIGEVGRFLLDDKEDLYAPPLCGWSDLTIYKLYDFLIHMDDIETYGETVRKAGVECSIIPESKKMDHKEFKLVLNALADRVLTRKGKVKSGRPLEMYVNSLFPAFTMDKYVEALSLFLTEEEVEYGISLLPDVLRNRWNNNLEPQVANDSMWYPVDRKGTLCLVDR